MRIGSEVAASEHWVPTKEASALAFQNWRRFKEAFAPELVERALRETGEVTHLVDPFGGSGTTALTAQFLGAHTTTIEVNPFLADLIEAKLAKYDFPRLVKAFAAVMQAGRTARPKLSVVFAQAPATLIEPGLNGRYIFGSRLARRLAGFRCAIDEVKDPAIKNLFSGPMPSSAVQISNVVVSGKGMLAIGAAGSTKKWFLPTGRYILPERTGSL